MPAEVSLLLLLSSLAFAQEPVPELIPEVPVPDTAAEELERLRAELAAAQALYGEQNRIRALERLLAEASVLSDDRNPVEARVAAAAALGESRDPRALPFLRAATRDRDSAVKLAAAVAALHIDDPDATEVAREVLVDRYALRDAKSELVGVLGDHDTRAAAGLLYDVTSERQVPARIRGEAAEVLKDRYPDLLASLGPIRSVADPFGGLVFVSAGGLAGGFLLSSVGVWGQFDGATAMGAVGGSAIGLGGGALYAATKPVTAGQGLSFASGVTWGLTAAMWTTTAARRYEGGQVAAGWEDVAAGHRALGVLAGGGIGLYGVSRKPRAWDVLEVDTAGYLGSAVVQGAAAVAFYRPYDGPLTTATFTGPTQTSTAITSRGSPTRFPETPALDHDREAARWLAGAAMAGAGVGLGAGVLLAERWELGFEDAIFAGVLGGEGAWMGTWGPAALGIDDSDLKGTIRLPWHAFAAGGLVLAEARPVTLARSGSTAWGIFAGNMLGAGVPMMGSYDDRRAVSAWMVPVGAVGTVAGYAAHPWVDPDARDAAMIGVGTALAGSEALLVGLALDDLETWTDSSQGIGLSLVTTGVAGAGLYVLGREAELRIDRTLVLGCAAAWGSYYGGLVPWALKVDAAPHTSLFAAAATEAAFTGLAAGLMSPRIGLQPRSTVVPQLGGLTGATGGALVAALVSQDGEDVAQGSVIGATLGFAVGAAVEGGSQRGPRKTAVRGPRLPGTWMPSVSASVDGTPLVGLVGSGL